jgi:hypothetical protein
MAASTTYFVAHDVRLPNGSVLRDVRLSREIQRPGTLRRVFRRIRRSKPHAFMVQVDRYR